MNNSAACVENSHLTNGWLGKRWPSVVAMPTVFVRVWASGQSWLCVRSAWCECLRASRMLLADPGCKGMGRGAHLEGVFASVSHMFTDFEQLAVVFDFLNLYLCRNSTGESSSPHLNLQQANQMTRFASTQSSLLKHLKVNKNPRTRMF